MLTLGLKSGKIPGRGGAKSQQSFQARKNPLQINAAGKTGIFNRRPARARVLITWTSTICAEVFPQDSPIRFSIGNYFPISRVISSETKPGPVCSRWAAANEVLTPPYGFIAIGTIFRLNLRGLAPRSRLSHDGEGRRILVTPKHVHALETRLLAHDFQQLPGS